MIIRDGNLRFALLSSLTGQWTGVEEDCNYFFGFRDNDMQQPLVSVNFNYPIDYSMTIEDGKCYAVIDKTKHTLWYRENAINVRLELHTIVKKIKLQRAE